MNRIYCNCKMNLRKEPGLDKPIKTELSKGSILDVDYITEIIDGYRWFRVPNGFVANVDEVYYHSESYNSSNVDDLKTTIKAWLESSLDSTTIAIEDMKKAIDEF